MYRLAFLLVVAVGGLAVAVASALGYGDRPHTVRPADYPICSVTADGPSFSATLRTMTYGGGTSCTHGIGSRQITVSAQVRGSDGRWYTISGSRRFHGFTAANPLREFGHRPAWLGHAYRTVATANLIVPNGFAGCSLRRPPACDEHITVTARSGPIAP